MSPPFRSRVLDQNPDDRPSAVRREAITLRDRRGGGRIPFHLPDAAFGAGFAGYVWGRGERAGGVIILPPTPQPAAARAELNYQLPAR